MKKNTDDLHQEIRETADLQNFLTENQEEFLSDALIKELTRLCREKKITKAALAKNACLSEIYLHQIFSGRRSPSRDRLICLSFGLGATLEETQQLLKLSGQAQLYPREKRDAIIQHAMLHGTSLEDLNQELYDMDMLPLY